MFQNPMSDEELIAIEEQLLISGDDFRCMPLSQGVAECENAGELMIKACFVIKAMRNDITQLIKLSEYEVR